MLKGNGMKDLRNVLAVFFLAFGAHLAALALDLPRSGILLDIVSKCIDTSASNYCSVCISPRADANCSIMSQCTKTTEVWSVTDEYVAIRDIKMCACPAGFVHGLALPRYPVTGVEDPKRPDGIWSFAWNAARSRIEPESIALVVNPQFRRSQNQLHVHLLRLKDDAHSIDNSFLAGHVDNLDSVWSLAQDSAHAQGLSDYGVLVKAEGARKFAVYIASESPEALFTQATCR